MKVLNKQTNSKLCFICGVDNEFGLKAPFYEMEDNSVVSIFTYHDYHQSYPERVHGGLITAMLDEIAGRAIWIIEPNTWAVTTEIKVKFRKIVPYDTKLKAIGRIVKNTKRIFYANAELFDLDGNLLAEAEVTYFKLPLDKISTTGHDDVNIYIPDDVKEID